MKEQTQPYPDTDLEKALEERLFGPNDLVLVMDTSFLIQLGQQNLWAYNVWYGTKNKALTEGKQFLFFISNDVIDEYESMLAKDRRDQYGLPFVNRTLEDVLGSLEDINLALDNSAMTAATEAWRTHASLRFHPESAKVRRGPADTDLSVLAHARTIAQQGAHVYVASCDLKDVIGPLVHDGKRIIEEGLTITPMGPSDIEINSFKGTDWQDPSGKLRPALNREVVADLQAAKLHPGASTFIVFEKDVHSGDATFDVAVGVEEFQSRKHVQIPDRYRKDGGRYFLLPALKVRSLFDNGDGNIIKSYFQKSNPSLPFRVVVVENTNPYSPVLISRPTQKDMGYTWYPTFQTSSDFLYYQTNSEYARGHYQPNVRSTKRRRP